VKGKQGEEARADQAAELRLPIDRNTAHHVQLDGDRAIRPDGNVPTGQHAFAVHAMKPERHLCHLPPARMHPPDHRRSGLRVTRDRLLVGGGVCHPRLKHARFKIDRKEHATVMKIVYRRMRRN